LEFKSEINNNLVNSVYQKFLTKIRENVELCLGLGGILFKPIFKNNDIYVDVLLPADFKITHLNTHDEIVGFVVIDEIIIKTNNNITIYTKVENHYFDESKKEYTITNEIYVEENNSAPKKTDLSVVEKWQGLKPKQVYTDIPFPLFVYYKTPIANNLNAKSPLGISIFNDSLYNLEFHDNLKLLLKGELSKTKSKVFTDVTITDDIINTDKKTFNDCCTIAKLEDDYFYKGNFGGKIEDGTPLYVVHNEIRNRNYQEVIAENLQLIEKQIGLHAGTLAESSKIERTATELLITRQNTYSTVVDNQTKLKQALEELIKIFNFYLNKNGKYTVYFDFDDSVVSNRQEQFKEYQNLLALGIISKEEFRSWYFGEDLETSKSKLPRIDELEDGI